MTRPQAFSETMYYRRTEILSLILFKWAAVALFVMRVTQLARRSTLPVAPISDSLKRIYAVQFS